MAHLLVTYRRKGRSKKQHQCGFECGERNNELVIRHALNTNSSIVKVQEYEQSVFVNRELEASR